MEERWEDRDREAEDTGKHTAAGARITAAGGLIVGITAQPVKEFFQGVDTGVLNMPLV